MEHQNWTLTLVLFCACFYNIPINFKIGFNLGLGLKEILTVEWSLAWIHCFACKLRLATALVHPGVHLIDIYNYLIDAFFLNYSFHFFIMNYLLFTMADLDNLDDAAEGEGECEEDDDDGEDDQQVGADTLALLAS